MDCLTYVAALTNQIGILGYKKQIKSKPSSLLPFQPFIGMLISILLVTFCPSPLTWIILFGSAFCRQHFLEDQQTLSKERSNIFFPPPTKAMLIAVS